MSLLIASCKNEWLDVKPSKMLVDASTLADFQGILDNNNLLNKAPALGFLSADNFYVSVASWQATTSTLQRNTYVWADDLYEAETQNPDWTNAYARILVSNVVLDGIEKFERTHGVSEESKVLRGAALFFRSFDFLNLAQIFCMPYGNQEYQAYGLPLKLNSNVNERPDRAKIDETYFRVVNDLQEACSVLPATITYKTRPSKAAAYGLLARAYLFMQEYDKALRYADSCIQIGPDLLDYNTLLSSANYPVPALNDEVILHADLAVYSLNYGAAFNVDSNLYNSYLDTDLRKALFFRAQADGIKYRGSYSGSAISFGGISISEMFLIRSECQARLGNVDAALRSLGELAKHRMETGVFNGFRTMGNEAEVLNLVLEERRKELLFRGLRWPDLKRLNADGSISPIGLTRILGDAVYNLQPNDPKYALPIPPNELIGNDIRQNPR